MPDIKVTNEPIYIKSVSVDLKASDTKSVVDLKAGEYGWIVKCIGIASALGRVVVGTGRGYATDLTDGFAFSASSTRVRVLQPGSVIEITI